MKIAKPIRWQMLLDYINENNLVSMKKLMVFSDEKGIPQISTRRDVKELTDLGMLKNDLGIFKLSIKKDQEIARDSKRQLNIDRKRKIASYVNQHLEDFTSANDCIFVGSGTTLEEFVHAINVPIEKLYTCGVEVAREAALNENIKHIFILGGEYRPLSHAISGEDSIEQIRNLSFTAAFFTATHVLADGFIYNNHLSEAKLIAKIMETSKVSHFLLDSSKFNIEIGGVKVTPLSHVDNVVTDDGIKEVKNQALNKITNLVIAS